MSSYTGLDLAPSALRWHVRDGMSREGEDGGPIYGIRGCPAYPKAKGDAVGAYDSAVSWSDALAFREGEFTERFESGVEKTVRYELAEGRASEWLRSFFRSPTGHPRVDGNGTIAVALPDHASPEDRDEILAGLSATKYANVSLVWRPVAALLAWMDRREVTGEADPSSLLGRRVFVLDLDGGRPEVTELACVRHRGHRAWIVPSRQQPKAASVAKDDAFERACYEAALGGLSAWEQIVGGQFYGDLQQAIESGSPDFEAWIRDHGAWEPQTVAFARELPQDILRTLNPVIADVLHALKGDDILLVNGWIARRYGDQLLRPFKTKCRNVSVLDADSVSRGAALFAERLAKGEPTFYDRIADYRFWDGFMLKFQPMFNSEVEVEPGKEYRYPEPGQPARRIRVEKFADNVSFYVREMNSREYARRIKTDFVEFLRTDLTLSLSAVVSPEKGSARFVLTMCDDHLPAIFVSGKKAVREIVLRWSSALNANKSVSIEFINEHQGFVEPQPVLGRIYDSEDNLRMVEEYVHDPNGPDFQRLWTAYAARFHPSQGKGIADRVGYHARPPEPTRGLFGTKRVFNSRVDAATQAYAAKIARDKPYVTAALIQGMGTLLRDGMLQQNYCHCGALDDYKTLIRQRLRAVDQPQWNFNFYFAPGYVLGEDPGDIALLLDYICATTNLAAERGKLWWSFFRMLCWHPECKLTQSDRPVLEQALSLLCSHDAPLLVHGDQWARNDVKYLLLAILFALRIRESCDDLSSPCRAQLVAILSPGGLLSNVPFPQTMIPHVDPLFRPAGDNLSRYVLRFVMREDTLADRELGAAMGGV